MGSDEKLITLWKKTMLLFSEYKDRDSFLTPHGDHLKLDRVLKIQLKVWIVFKLQPYPYSK